MSVYDPTEDLQSDSTAKYVGFIERERMRRLIGDFLDEEVSDDDLLGMNDTQLTEDAAERFMERLEAEFDLPDTDPHPSGMESSPFDGITGTLVDLKQHSAPSPFSASLESAIVHALGIDADVRGEYEVEDYDELSLRPVSDAEGSMRVVETLMVASQEWLRHFYGDEIEVKRRLTGYSSLNFAVQWLKDPTAPQFTFEQPALVNYSVKHSNSPDMFFVQAEVPVERIAFAPDFIIPHDNYRNEQEVKLVGGQTTFDIDNIYIPLRYPEETDAEGLWQTAYALSDIFGVGGYEWGEEKTDGILCNLVRYQFMFTEFDTDLTPQFVGEEEFKAMLRHFHGIQTLSDEETEELYDDLVNDIAERAGISDATVDELSDDLANEGLASGELPSFEPHPTS